jgi:RHS repeat-associated protein
MALVWCLAGAGHALAFIPAKDVRGSLNDGWQIVEERDGGNNAENRYIYGTGINEVVRYTKADGLNRYFTYDGLGSMTEVFGGDGALQESYTYMVYGTVTMRNAGGSIIPDTSHKNRLHFTGYELDPDTGLYLARNRWYHPRLARFMQPDPIGLAGGDLNFYRYCQNNPVNWVDPEGLNPAFLQWLAQLSQRIAASPAGQRVAQWGQQAWQAGVRYGQQAWQAGARWINCSTKLNIQFGGNANQIQHAFRHTDTLGLTRADVQSRIINNLQTVASQITPGQPFNQVITISGQRIQYTAWILANGTINVGRIHAVP